MINQKRVAELCIELDIFIEEFFMCYNIYIRNQQINPDSNKILDKYYKRPQGWIEIARKLEEKGLIENLKPNNNTIELKNLIITEKFTDLIFINSDEIWERFYKKYPKIRLTPQGSYEYDGNWIKEGDKEYFIKNILKNADKFQASKILYVMDELFQVDPDTGLPTIYCQLGISRFLRNWETIVKEFEDKGEVGGNWSTKML